MYDLLQFIAWFFTAWQPLAIIPGVLFVMWLYSAWRRRGAPYDRCARCGYAIEGLTRPVCPECGADLSQRGIRPAGEPALQAWVGSLATWTLVWLAVAILFGGGPLSHWMPQPYNVQWRSVDRHQYVEGETGRKHITMNVAGTAFHWPWQRTVTAEAMMVYITAIDMTTGPAGMGGYVPTTLWWFKSHDKVLMQKGRFGTPGTPMGAGPINADMLADYLQLSPADKPVQTAERIAADLDAHRVIIGEAAATTPPFTPTMNTTWASPAYGPLIAGSVRWLCLLLWIIFGAIAHYRWRRGRRVDWQAPTVSQT